jgi:CBS domain-containing protein
MRAADIMTVDVVMVTPETPVPEIARVLHSQRIGGAPVVDASRRPVGLVSEGDLTRRAGLSAGRNGAWWLLLFEEREDVARDYVRAHDLRAADVMTRPVASVAEDTGIADIARLLEERHIKRVPVVRAGRVVGIVTRGDVVRALGSNGIYPPDHGDIGLRERVLAAFAAIRLSPATRVSIIVAAGEVHLWGAIADEKERQRLVDRVIAVTGVPRVVNHLGGR